MSKPDTDAPNIYAIHVNLSPSQMRRVTVSLATRAITAALLVLEGLRLSELPITDDALVVEVQRQIGVTCGATAEDVADVGAADDLTPEELDKWDADCDLVGTDGMVIPRLIREVRRRRAVQTERKAVAS